MQNAKDTFFVMLKSRLATLNPARTIVVRGVLRPGVLVDENELATASLAIDAFRLQWTALEVDGAGPLPLVRMACEIRYASDGNPGNGGMDRGRLLAGMDAELSASLGAQPQCAQKMNYALSPPGAMATSIFWTDSVFGATTTAGERVERTTSLNIFAYQEAGER